MIEAKNWDGTDIKKEADPPGVGFHWNVQEKTRETIENLYSLGTDDFLVCDDRANEIADYVLIQGGLRKKITFFHCKYQMAGTMKKPQGPGVSREEITELTDQGVRTGHWIGATNLVDRLLSRIATLSKLVCGTEADLKALARNFYPSEWTYAVVLVQPGLSRDKLISSQKPSQAEQLLIVLADRITTDYGAKFLIWTSA